MDCLSCLSEPVLVAQATTMTNRTLTPAELHVAAEKAFGIAIHSYDYKVLYGDGTYQVEVMKPIWRRLVILPDGYGASETMDGNAVMHAAKALKTYLDSLT